ncbi:substrate-binding domain-containing protein [Microbacterium sp. JB110]|uniref:substrate-binding domain-containing protein n=1 Tax=Microbacterium sp. JB110 TaxID=2024477 RepID=UPI00097ECF9E|nr:substrate-binding domain-containing protein [Microbacterium sp. JB110]RCS60349.1 sugar ABC transporter substrate-binding protein [Microbacterium sp. JB110]SJM48970.1 Ribose ABC transporter, periplasmic ribose-binding protein RbsB (TC 3.A.1.2.1) [Frigoribacterium sp. JB110]
MSERITWRKLVAVPAALAAGALLLTGCIGNEPPEEETDGGTSVNSGTSNDETGDTVTIGFSAPAADHGWMGAITSAALETAESYDDVELLQAEATNDVNAQISHIETFINDGVDAIVLLPFDGDALTEVALDAMEAGIPVINVDREFSSPFASRATILGDNYGMGVSAGTYICEQLDGQSDAVVAEIQGIANLPLTQDRSQGFADALDDCGLSVSTQVSADFTIQGGETATSNLLQAEPEIDAIWNHDDDQGVGVLAAIDNADRDEFFMVGGAGSLDVMEMIEAGDTVMHATVVYPSTQAADGVKLARLVAQDKNLGDLVSADVPRTIQLHAPVVTEDNVDQYIDLGFRS